MSDEVVTPDVTTTGTPLGVPAEGEQMPPAIIPFPTKKRLSAADIIAVQDVKTIDVEVPDWGGTVKLRSVSASEAMAFADQMKKNEKEAPVRLLVMSAVDENDQPMFTEASVAALQKKSLKNILLLQNAAMELNGLTDAAAKAAKNA